jgi:hypothetical protein
MSCDQASAGRETATAFNLSEDDQVDTGSRPWATVSASSDPFQVKAWALLAQ